MLTMSEAFRNCFIRYWKYIEMMCLKYLWKWCYQHWNCIALVSMRFFRFTWFQGFCEDLYVECDNFSFQIMNSNVSLVRSFSSNGLYIVLLKASIQKHREWEKEPVKLHTCQYLHFEIRQTGIDPKQITHQWRCFTGDPLHNRALAHSRAPLFTQPCPPLFTQPCPGRTMSTAVCIYVARLCASCPAV